MRGNKRKKKLAFFVLFCMMIAWYPTICLRAEEEVSLTCRSAILMEGETGTILFEKDSKIELAPASITKIMTLLLTFEALKEGKISLQDEVSVSEHAASMGGSQVYLEPFETQTVETMIKCISIASANDASVAMAEYIAGSEEAFVNKMNERAKELGMENTHFVNCYGLDTNDHYSCAHDVALMSRELIMKHPEISEYSTVWMDTIIHKTRKGESEFGLTNTNKLIKSFNGITGLKTGSTGIAKYCLSATARREGMNLIAVVMAAPDTKVRFKEAAALLNYGFANTKMYREDFADYSFPEINVKKGEKETVLPYAAKPFVFLCTAGQNPAEIRYEMNLPESVLAPVEKDSVIGTVTFYYGEKKIGEMNLCAGEKIEEIHFMEEVRRILKEYMGINKNE